MAGEHSEINILSFVDVAARMPKHPDTMQCMRVHVVCWTAASTLVITLDCEAQDVLMLGHQNVVKGWSAWVRKAHLTSIDELRVQPEAA